MDNEPQSIEDIIFPPDRRIPISSSLDETPVECRITYFAPKRLIEPLEEETEKSPGRKSILDFL